MTNLKFCHVLLCFLVSHESWRLHLLRATKNFLSLRIKEWLHLVYSVNECLMAWFSWVQKFGNMESIVITIFFHSPFHSGFQVPLSHFFPSKYYAKMLQYKVGCCHQVPIPKVSSISSRCQRSQQTKATQPLFFMTLFGCLQKCYTTVIYYIQLVISISM